MTHQDLVKKIRGKFWQLLQAKTGWGKNEVVRVFDRACTTVLSAALDELEAEGRQPSQTVTFPNSSVVEFRESADKGRFRSLELPQYTVVEDEKNLSIQPKEA
jgi:hypothetical protein